MLGAPDDRCAGNPVAYIFQMLASLVEDHRQSERARIQRDRCWAIAGKG